MKIEVAQTRSSWGSWVDPSISELSLFQASGAESALPRDDGRHSNSMLSFPALLQNYLSSLPCLLLINETHQENIRIFPHYWVLMRKHIIVSDHLVNRVGRHCYYNDIRCSQAPFLKRKYSEINRWRVDCIAIWWVMNDSGSRVGEPKSKISACTRE